MTVLSLIELNPRPEDFPHVGAFGLTEVSTYDTGSICAFWTSKAGTDLEALCENLELWVYDGHEPDAMLAAICGWQVGEPREMTLADWITPITSIPVTTTTTTPTPIVREWCCATSTPPPPMPPSETVPVPLVGTDLLLASAIALAAIVRRRNSRVS